MALINMTAQAAAFGVLFADDADDLESNGPVKDAGLADYACALACKYTARDHGDSDQCARSMAIDNWHNLRTAARTWLITNWAEAPYKHDMSLGPT